MQTERRRSVIASLVLVVVMVFAWGLASAVLVAGSHSTSMGGTTAKMPTDLTQIETGMTKVLHPLWASKGVVGPGGSAIAVSYNWAGYAAVPSTGGSTFMVQGNWYVPTVTCSEPGATTEAFTVQWVGIDGYSDSDVEQAGSAEYCSGHGAAPEYYTWWEFAPFNSIQVAYTTTPNAYISASVVYDPAEYVNGVQGVWNLQLYDVDNGHDFLVTASDDALGYSPNDLGAECISEAPAGDTQTTSGLFPLAKYTPTTFYGCAAAIGTHFDGIGSFGSAATLYQIEQCNYPACSKVLQSPGGVGKDSAAPQYGKSEFKLTWKGYD